MKTPEELYRKVTMSFTRENAIELIKQAKSEWCKEQRNICVNKFKPLDEREKAIYKGILNAPEPE